ncbi:hypothetical protein BCR33DRAFT_723160 [Rhizoclosmatium globosum]|uniref:Uncharacterized protein n=1 Tax=Rhizoclosmatium globosum TaxID=329046 RepID=A0A1Y2BFJ4_9FUNG|nr:hypothetical protein BCR33DRAFT_723160 [Rhizoclosmatium globosum]|eukprot:ORY33584.1 hypothetical protein BCR33DRAFT_723160 [Rhizoclosmatium globosum]
MDGSVQNDRTALAFSSVSETPRSVVLQSSKRTFSKTTSPTATTTATTTTTTALFTTPAKFARLTSVLLDSPAHAENGMMHTATVISSLLLSTKYYIKLNAPALINSSLDLSHLPSLVLGVRNFWVSPTHSAHLFPVLRDSSAHIGEHHVPWGSDFECLLRTAQASIVLHCIAGDSECFRTLSTNQGSRVDKILITLVLACLKLEPVLPAFQIQGFLVPHDLGLMPLGLLKVGLRRCLTGVKVGLIRFLKALKMSPVQQDLESLLKRTGGLKVDKRSGSVFGQGGLKEESRRYPGSNLTTLCKLVLEAQLLLKLADDELLSLQSCISMIGSCIELQLFTSKSLELLVASLNSF